MFDNWCMSLHTTKALRIQVSKNLRRPRYSEQRFLTHTSCELFQFCARNGIKGFTFKIRLQFEFSDLRSDAKFKGENVNGAYRSKSRQILSVDFLILYCVTMMENTCTYIFKMQKVC